jgi:aminopeptidase N
MDRLNNGQEVLLENDLPGRPLLTGLHTLVGDATFRRSQQSFVDRYRDRPATTQDYLDLANRVSGRDLTVYFDGWLYGDTTPPMPGHSDWHSS